MLFGVLFLLFLYNFNILNYILDFTNIRNYQSLYNRLYALREALYIDNIIMNKVFGNEYIVL